MFDDADVMMGDGWNGIQQLVLTWRGGESFVTSCTQLCVSFALVVTPKQSIADGGQIGISCNQPSTRPSQKNESKGNKRYLRITDYGYHTAAKQHHEIRRQTSL